MVTGCALNGGRYYCLLINGDANKVRLMVNTICTIRTILSFSKSFFDSYDTCSKHTHYFFCVSI